jgi:hypothetical protein
VEKKKNLITALAGNSTPVFQLVPKLTELCRLRQTPFNKLTDLSASISEAHPSFYSSVIGLTDHRNKGTKYEHLSTGS